MEREGGAGRRGEPTPSQAGRPDQKQTPQQRGEGIRGVPPPGEQVKPQQERGERQLLAGVWEVLEHLVKLHDPQAPRKTGGEYSRELHAVNRLLDELDEKGTRRDRLIHELYEVRTYEPADAPTISLNRELSREEFQQFRSWVEPLSDEEIGDEIRKQREENNRKAKEFFKGKRILPPQTQV